MSECSFAPESTQWDRHPACHLWAAVINCGRSNSRHAVGQASCLSSLGIGFQSVIHSRPSSKVKSPSYRFCFPWCLTDDLDGRANYTIVAFRSAKSRSFPERKTTIESGKCSSPQGRVYEISNLAPLRHDAQARVTSQIPNVVAPTPSGHVSRGRGGRDQCGAGADARRRANAAAEAICRSAARCSQGELNLSPASTIG